MYFGIIGLGRAYVAADGIRIKGIAVGAEWSKILGFSEVVIPDTPVDVDFNVSILKYINDSTAEYLAQAPFNTTRYTNSDTVFVQKDSTTVDTLPLYEVFFNNPITVTDTFYSFINAASDKDEAVITAYHSPYFSVSYFDLLSHYPYHDTVDIYFPKGYTLEQHMTTNGEKYFRWALYDSNNRMVYNLFPILDIPESAGVEPTDAIGSNAGLWPNPAQDECTVASGYGLRNVEVYDIGGRLVMKQAASGLATRIDTSQLPRGTYLVKIETLLGSTTKKLVVE